MPSPMNVVLILSDQHRRDAMGCAGHPMVRTPNLDRLASQGVRFERAYAASPVCGPCRSATFTGRHVHRCGALTHAPQHLHRDMGLPTMGHAFRDAGYTTAAFGKLHVAGETDDNDLGFDQRALRIYTPTANDYQHTVGLENFWKYCSYLPRYRPSPQHESRNGYNPTNAPIDLPDELLFDHMVADRSLAFLRQRGDEPFFLSVGFEKPHTELYAPARFHEMYDPADVELPTDIWHPRDRLPSTINDNPDFPIVTRDAYTDDELRACVAAYYANVSYLDEQVGRVLDGLDELGLRDNTLVIYASDHGENLFNHGLVQKQCFFEPAVGAPMIVRRPREERPGRACADLASLLDLFPTLLDATGVDGPKDLDGVSLLPRLEDDDDRPLRDAVFSELYLYGAAERMVRTERWKYVHSQGDTHQLYDLRHDPGELRNLIDDPAHAAIAHELDDLVRRDWAVPDLDDVPRRRGDTRPGQRHAPTAGA